jgi:pimeloyl-ACP methyl ester carboxylesterase
MKGIRVLMRLVLCVVLCFALSGCCALMKGKPTSEKGKPTGEMTRPTPFAKDKFIKVGDVNYHYAEYPAKGKNILLVHGFASSSYSWESVAPLLQKQGYHVYALDMKGFGWTDKPRNSKYDTYALMYGVKAWMDAVGLKKVVYVGNSLGGAVGVLMAIEYPKSVDKLVLIDAGGYPMKMPMIIRLSAIPGSVMMTKAFFGKWMLNWNLKEVFYHKDWVTPDRIDNYYVRLATPGAIDAQSSVIDSLDFAAFDRFIKRIPDVKIPTLIIWGKDDYWIPVENAYKFRKDLVNSVLCIIPECGHVPQEEHPAVTAKLILDYLNKKFVKDTVLTPSSEKPNS